MDSRNRVFKCVEREGDLTVVAVDENGVAMYTSPVKPGADENSHCRGSIKVDDKFFCPSFPFCDEFTDETFAELPKGVNNPAYFNYVEGTLIKIYHAKGKWYMSTHKKLDAFDCKWASENVSFGTSFLFHLRSILKHIDPDFNIFQKDEEVFYEFCEKHLSKSHKYCFMLKHDYSEKIVCDVATIDWYYDNKKNVVINKSPIEFVGMYDVENNLSFNHNMPVAFPTNVELHFRTAEDLTQYVRYINWREYPGVMILYRDEVHGVKAVSVLNSEYKRLFNLRGNVPNVLERYQQLYERGYDQYSITVFENMYPVVVDQNYELTEVVKRVEKLYRERHIRGCKSRVLGRATIAIVDGILHKNYLNKRDRVTYHTVFRAVSKFSRFEKLLNEVMSITYL